MNKKTLKALQGSIKKWEKIVDGTGVDEGISNCPLCELFYDEHNCYGCPIQMETGQVECKNTPYTIWNNHLQDEHDIPDDEDAEIQSDCPVCLSLAKKELEFLKSLLPKETK